MSWNEVKTEIPVVKIQDKKIFIGVYVKSKEIKKGSCIHYFKQESQLIGFWGFVDFDRAIARVEPGSLVKLEYLGKVKEDNKEHHRIKIYVDNEVKKIDVSNILI